MTIKYYCEKLGKQFKISDDAIPATYGFICDCGNWFASRTGLTHRYVQDYYSDSLNIKLKDGSFKYKTFGDLIRPEKRSGHQHKLVQKNKSIGEIENGK
jgi:hypothetical protein